MEEQILAGYPPPLPQGTVQRQQYETRAKSFCARGLFASLGALSYGTGLWFGTHLVAYLGIFWGGRPVVATCALYLSLAPNSGYL